MFFFTLLTLSGCADWNSTPSTVDQHHGLAVREMIKNQTLYPEHGRQPKQVLSLDAKKSEGIMRAYRATAMDLERGKQNVTINVDGGNKQ